MSLLGTSNVEAQDSINGIRLNVQISHFIASEKHTYFDPLDPGFEIVYRRKLSRSSAVLFGVNYSFCKMNYRNSSNGTKQSAHEVALPLMFERSIGQKAFVTIGSYAGWLVSGKVIKSHKFSSGWIDVTNYSDYSESSKFTMDLYLDFGYIPTLAPKHPISIAPFIKYKLVDNWMEEVRAKTHFGFKVNCTFGL